MKIHHEYMKEFVKETILLHSEKLAIPQNNNEPYFYKIKPHIFEREYVTGVLGISLPLNESYPYSGPVHHQIVAEQRALEDFFRYTDDDIWLIVEEDMLREQEEGEEDVSAWSWTGAMRLAGDSKTAAAALKMMAVDPARIKAFVETAMGVVMEPFESLKNFFETIVKKAGEWGLNVFKKIGEFASKLWNPIKEMVDKVNNLSGWKQALAAGAAVLGIKSVWGKWGQAIGAIMDKFNEFNAIVEGAPIEPYVHTAGLLSALYEKDDQLNEFLGFGKKEKKKDKWAQAVEDMEKDEKEEEGMTDEEKRRRRAKKKSDAADAKEEKRQGREDAVDTAEDVAEDPSAVVDKAVGAVEKKGGWAAKMGKENISAEDQAKGSEIIKWLKDKFIKGFQKKSKKVVAKMAARAAAAAATGGVSEYIATLAKMYKNLGTALKTLRPAFAAAAEPAEIKDEIKDEGGEEEFWSQGTDTGKGSKEEKKNEVLLRKVVREALLREAKI